MGKIHGSANLLVPVALSGRSAGNIRVILGKLESHRRVKYFLTHPWKTGNLCMQVMEDVRRSWGK